MSTIPRSTVKRGLQTPPQSSHRRSNHIDDSQRSRFGPDETTKVMNRLRNRSEITYLTASTQNFNGDNVSRIRAVTAGLERMGDRSQQNRRHNYYRRLSVNAEHEEVSEFPGASVQVVEFTMEEIFWCGVLIGLALGIVLYMYWLWANQVAFALALKRRRELLE